MKQQEKKALKMQIMAGIMAAIMIVATVAGVLIYFL